MNVKDEIKKAVEAQGVVIGTRSVSKAVKNGVLKKILCAENTPELTRDSVKIYSNASETEFIMFNGNSIELGRLCGKPFGISLLGIRK